MRRIPGHQNGLFDSIEFDGIHIGNRAKHIGHLKLIPRTRHLQRNLNAFHRTSQKVHEKSNLHGTIDHGRTGQSHDFAGLGFQHRLLQGGHKGGLIENTANQVMGFVNDDDRILKVGFLQKCLDLLRTQTRLTDKAKPLVDQIQNLLPDVLLSLLVQNVLIIRLSRDGGLLDSVGIQKGLGQSQVPSRFPIRIAANALSPPVVGSAIHGVSTLHNFATKVVLQVGGHHNVDLLLAQQALGDRNRRTRFSGSQSVIQQQSTLRRLNRQVIPNQGLLGKQLARCFAFFRRAV